MNELTSTRPPIWFWIVAIFALLWNLVGCAAYWMEVTIGPEQLAELEADVQRLYETVPTWATAAFAVAVWAGLLGSVGLLLRKKWAAPVFVISLLGVLVQMTHSFFLSDTFEVMGNDKMAFPILVIVLAIFLVWFSSTARARRWID